MNSWTRSSIPFLAFPSSSDQRQPGAHDLVRRAGPFAQQAFSAERSAPISPDHQPPGTRSERWSTSFVYRKIHFRRFDVYNFWR